MHTKFKCNHCGFCCFEIATQINVTLGDIKRLSASLKIPVKDLFWKYIGINPFKDTETKFDYELGLNIPCNFWRNNRCILYNARPLNCRLFPYWILANAPKDRLKEFFHSDNQCLNDFEFNEKYRSSYQEYTKKLGKILLKESKITDIFLKKNNLQQSIDISKNEEYLKLLKNYSGKELDRKKIELCQNLIDKKVYPKLPELVEKDIKIIEIIDINELKKIENIIQ